MESLRTFLNSLDSESQAAFAASCGTTIGYLRKAISTGQILSAGVCAQIELQTSRAVRRWDLRPQDWHRIWTELVGHPDAPAVPCAATEAG